MELEVKATRIKHEVPLKTRRALELAAEKGASVWLTALPPQELGFTLNKREFRDAIKLRYDWPIDDLPSTCVCGDTLTVDHAMTGTPVFGNGGYERAWIEGGVVPGRQMIRSFHHFATALVVTLISR